MTLFKLQYSTAITTAINEAELGEDAEKGRLLTFCIAFFDVDAAIFAT